MNKITPAIEESHRLIAEAIKHFSLNVDPADVVITIQTKGRKNALGWFWRDRWQAGKTKVHEINLSAEHLIEHNMGETLLHELAHAENHHNDIEDTDKTGRRHNKKFKAQAEALGLVVNKMGSYGYAHTDLGAPAETFLKNIKFNRDVFSMVRIPPQKGKVGSRLVKCECEECGYTARITQKWIDTGLPVCYCGGEFHVSE